MRMAVDADVCIYAVSPTPWTSDVRRMLAEADELVGSVLLPVEVLAKPLRTGAVREGESLQALLRRIRLLDLTLPIAALATTLAAEQGLHAADAVHLATAVEALADVFLTNNRSDFGRISLDRPTIAFPRTQSS